MFLTNDWNGMQLETSTSHCQTKTLCHTRPGTVLHRQILWTKSLTAGSQMIRNGSCRLHPLYNEMGYFHVHLTLIWMERKVNFAFSNKGATALLRWPPYYRTIPKFRRMLEFFHQSVELRYTSKPDRRGHHLDSKMVSRIY